MKTDQPVRLVTKAKPIEPAVVECCLENRFGHGLTEARQAMAKLASAFEPDELAKRGFSLYERFRPQIPEGVGGWGAKG
jgi:hypothetical protein